MIVGYSIHSNEKTPRTNFADLMENKAYCCSWKENVQTPNLQKIYTKFFVPKYKLSYNPLIIRC